LLNQLIRERFLVQPTTKLIPEVGLTSEGFIVGTTNKERDIAFLCILPNLELIKIPKSNFSHYETGA